MSKGMLGISVHDAQGVVTDLLEKLGGPEGQLWLKAHKRFLRKENPWPEAEKKERLVGVKSYPIFVNYNATLKQMIREGCYQDVAPLINDYNFTVGEGAPDCTVSLIYIEKAITSKEALALLDMLDMRPAKLPELLSLGTQWPELQREFDIVALDSVWRDAENVRFVPCLTNTDRGRGLKINRLGEGGEMRRWIPGTRFAAIWTGAN